MPDPEAFQGVYGRKINSRQYANTASSIVCAVEPEPKAVMRCLYLFCGRMSRLSLILRLISIRGAGGVFITIAYFPW